MSNSVLGNYFRNANDISSLRSQKLYLKSELYKICAQINKLIQEIKQYSEKSDLSDNRPHSNIGNFFSLEHLSDPNNICINCNVCITMYPLNLQSDKYSIDLLFNAKPIVLKTSQDHTLRQTIKELK